MKKHLTLLTTFVVALISILPISNASAETAWRYWSYWQLNDGTWEMAMTGAADVKAEDGQVQGWRYITAGMEVTADLAPRTDETFETICADVEKKDGIARVALVVDFGDASDYSNPDDIENLQSSATSCVEINEGDPSSLLLGSEFEVREETGMVCGVNNLPATGCGEEVEIPATEEPELTTTSLEGEVEDDEGNLLINLGGALAAVGIGFFIYKKFKKN
ncbi:MAG: hypothetical protein RLZZ330_1000 [Actinomycetota bacterium]|jgi:hypothetical protein